MDDTTNNTPGTIIPGGAKITPVPNAGRPADAPGLATEAAARNAAAAGELPQLYKDLAARRDLLTQTQSAAIDAHTIEMNVGGTPTTYHPADRKAVAAAITTDISAGIAKIEARIKELGFEPG